MQSIADRFRDSGMVEPFIGVIDSYYRKHSGIQHLVDSWLESGDEAERKDIIAHLESLIYDVSYNSL